MKDKLSESVMARLGGYMRGICHPGGDLQILRDAGIDWVRCDIPFPFNRDGSVTEWFESFCGYCDEIRDAGMKMLAITPYPADFADFGIDLFTDAGMMKCSDVMAYAAERLTGKVQCWQVTNEMFMIPFRSPLNEADSSKFIGACMKGVRRGDSSAIAGYNTFIRPDYFNRTEEYCGGSDYHGIDEYPGSWVEGGPTQLIKSAEWYYDNVKLPIILMEFGFPSRGGTERITKADIDDYIHKCGFSDIRAIHDNPESFIPYLTKPMQDAAKGCNREDLANFVTSNWEHLMKRWSTESVYPRSEEGQALFYAEALPLLEAHPHVIGAVSYCCDDLPYCGNCGQTDCPCETAWGIFTLEGKPKPAYYAIKRAYTGK